MRSGLKLFREPWPQTPTCVPQSLRSSSVAWEPFLLLECGPYGESGVEPSLMKGGNPPRRPKKWGVTWRFMGSFRSRATILRADYNLI